MFTRRIVRDELETRITTQMPSIRDDMREKWPYQYTYNGHSPLYIQLAILQGL